MPRWVAVVTLALAPGCSQPAPPPGPSSPPAVASRAEVHTFTADDNWGNSLGCKPHGDELAIEGTLIVRPFGKGTDGAVIQTATESYVVSYRAEGALLALRDKRVLARGRECEKQGASIHGKHFDLATLTEVAAP